MIHESKLFAIHFNDVLILKQKYKKIHWMHYDMLYIDYTEYII